MNEGLKEIPESEIDEGKNITNFIEGINLQENPQKVVEKVELQIEGEDESPGQREEAIVESKEVDPDLERRKAHRKALAEWQVKSNEQIAEERIEKFERLKEEYEKLKQELLGVLAEGKKSILPTGLAKGLKATRNFTRMGGDLLRSARSWKEADRLNELQIQARVMERDGFLEDPEFLELLKIDGNKEALSNLLNMEVFKEIPCERFLMLKNLSPEQFHALASELGYNPKAFLSDGRGENEGRLAIDNNLVNGEHPFKDKLDPEILEKEMKHWQSVRENVPAFLRWAIPKKWQMSRTHSVVYGVKDREGNDILLLPVHVDPKNAVAFLAKTEASEKGTMAYHQQAVEGEDPQYVGTGEYDLGIAYLIFLLRQAAEKGVIAGIDVEGEEKIRTRYSIIGDDRITWATEAEMKKKMG